MAKKKLPKEKNKWRHRYRLVVLDDTSFEERASVKLNKLNVMIIFLFLATVFVIATSLLISFTPLKEYIPGYANTVVPAAYYDLVDRTDSLQDELQANEAQYQRIKMVLSGTITSEEYTRIDSITQAETLLDEQDLKPIEQDSVLRSEVAREDRFNVVQAAQLKSSFVFFPPVQGTITAAFEPEEKHYAVDIATKEAAPIKAAATGTVILAGWTMDTGYTMIIEHAYGLLTVYKHASVLNHAQNDRVEAGEVIGTVGSTGALSTGPHLHFEIWSDGFALDPSEFVAF